LLCWTERDPSMLRVLVASLVEFVLIIAFGMARRGRLP
jgi:hypothetical protein